MNNDSRTESRSRSNEPAEEEIRKRAYELFQRRGGHPGRDKDDWNQAVKELKEERIRAQMRSVTPQSQTSSSTSSSTARESSGQETALPAKAPSSSSSSSSRVEDTSSAKSKKR